MPKALPGFYWDPDRTRYFPLSPDKTDASRKPKGRPKHNIADGHADPRASHPWHLAQRVATQTPCNWVGRERIIKGILSSHIGATTRLDCNHVPTLGKITSFCTYRGEDPQSDSTSRWHILGDGRGWLFRCKASYPNRQHDNYPSRLETDPDIDINRLLWSAELYLQPNGCISSLSMWGSRWVATGAGTSARFASSDIRSLDRMFIVTLPGARDLWASHLRERSVAFGASFRAIFIPDIDHSTTPEQLNTSSDVFTVVQDQNLVYAGSRNGSIHRFDKRVGFKQRGDLLLDYRFSGDRSSVLNLSLLAGPSDDDPSLYDSSICRTMESGLFVSQMNGQLQTFDLRFASSKSGRRGTQPVVFYQGHVNNHTRELGLAIDYQNDFVYAAGQDCRVRGWSLSSGEPIVPPPPPLSTPTFMPQTTGPMPLFSMTPRANLPQTPRVTPPWAHFNPFLAQFSDPIPVLRVSFNDSDRNYNHAFKSTTDSAQSEQDEKWLNRGNETTSLWAASGDVLWRWRLGQQNCNHVFA